MEKDEKKRRDEELDRFWNIDVLIPKKRAVHYESDTETTEIVIDPTPQEKTAEKINVPPREIAVPKAENAARPRFIPPHTAEEFSNPPMPDEEYVPVNALIHKVRIFRWRSDYRYYEGFVRDAVRLFSVTGVECPRVPFFSYVPQYTQMSRAQLEWYLWWRENLRHGTFLDTDYSYVLLYVYELINLSGRMNPQQAQNALCDVWVHYRENYRKLDSYLPEWICDYSLIHRLPPPSACTGRLLPEVMAHCTLKEFYVPNDGRDIYIRALLSFCSNYDYRKSKFYNAERASLFDDAVVGALRALIEHTSENGQLFSSVGMDDSKLSRDAFNGALCSYRVKRRIEVDFCSFSRSHELRYFLTDVVKHVENRVRAAVGVRSRLTVYALATPMRKILDSYLDEALPTKTRGTPKAGAGEAPASYEKLYDLPKKNLSLTDAAEIERLSWETTERLVEAFEDAEEAQGEPQRDPFSSPASFPMPTDAPLPADVDGESDTCAAAMRPYLSFLQAVRDGNAAHQRNAAQKAGVPLEVLADEVNALAVEHMGDILLEECDFGFCVIEDYRDLLVSLTEHV